MKIESTAVSPVSPIKTALDSIKMLDLFRNHFPEFDKDLELLEVTIENVSYQSATEATILYHLKVRKQGAESFSTQILTGRILGPDESPTFPPQELLDRFQSDTRFPFRTPVLYLPPLRMIFQSFPLDATLTWLPDAFDPATMKLQLNRFFANKKTRVKKVRSKVLSYQPDMRTTFLYELSCQSKETDETYLRHLIGKIHVHKDPSRLFACSWAFSQAAKDTPLNLATPVGYLFPYRLFLQEKVEGKRLGNVVDSPLLSELMRETARQIAALHRLSIPLISHRTAKVEAEFVNRWAKLLIEVCPDMADRIEKLTGRITSQILAQTKVSGTVHGDFQNTNALVNDGKITLIDLDEVAYGDPLTDVGRLLSSMRIPSLRQFGSFSAIENAQAAFLDEYLRQNPGDERRVRLFEAGSLIVSAASTFRQQRPNWYEEVPLLLDEAERIFAKAEPALQLAISTDGDNPDHPTLPFEERISWALDTTYIQAALQPYIHQRFGAVINTCQVASRYDTNNRSRIRYKLSGANENQKWKCTLLAMTWRKHTGRNFWFRLNELNQALEGDPDAPLLPRPIAYLPYFPLLVLEVVNATMSLSSLIKRSEALEPVQKMAQALASFHKAKAQFQRARPIQDELSKFRHRIKDKQIAEHTLGLEMTSLFEKVEKKVASIPEQITPVLRRVRPQRIFYQENRIVFTEFEWLAYSHPFVDVASFLSYLTLLKLRSKQPEDVKKKADHFRSVYISITKSSLHDLEAFEAFYLLRMAYNHIQNSEVAIAEQLLMTAQERVQTND